MNRRRFLSILAGTAAASTVSYFLPPIGGWRSDVIAHSKWKPLPYSLGFNCSAGGPILLANDIDPMWARAI